MSKKKVVIIGGGLSGLTSGIYLQKNGYETEILEKNAVSGGACIGWERKGCYIDGCIHWLTGISPKASYHELWKEIHAVKEDTEIFFQDEFSRFDFGDGTKIIFWTDIEKTRNEWLAFAPEDKKEIERFFKMVKRFQEIEGPVKKPVDLMHLGDLLKIAFTMCGDYYWVNKTSKFSCPEYASRFQNKYLRAFLAHHMSPNYNLMSMLYMFGHVTARDGGIPIGGSLPLIQRVEARYLELGGKMRNNAEVAKICVEGKRTMGVTLKNGEFIGADWIVSSTAAEHCLKDLLGGKYAVKKIDKRLADMQTYPTYTYTTAVLKCSADVADIPLSTHVLNPNPVVFDRPYNYATIRNYSYDKTMKAPDGTCVLQVSMHGDDNMYFWWKKAKDEGRYKDEKKKLGETLLALAERYYPQLTGKLEVIDVVTPCTYERYLNSRHGSFQGFVHTSKGKALMERGVVKGIDNFFLSGQCIFQSGGLPPAAFTGRFAAQRICKADKKKFIY